MQELFNLFFRKVLTGYSSSCKIGAPNENHSHLGFGFLKQTWFKITS